MKSGTVICTVCVVLLAPVLGQAGSGSGGNSPDVSAPDGVLCLTPVLERSCIAVRIPVSAAQALVGIWWYNNDGVLGFPKLLVASGLGDLPPIYDQAVQMAEDVSGATSSWSDIRFVEPIASASGSLYVIFQLPANTERTGLGVGGGPGFGYQSVDGGPCVFVSSDGNDWVRLRYDCRLMVEPIFAAKQPGMTTLAAPATQPDNESEVTKWQTALVSPYPNPFNPMSHIEFTLQRATKVKLSIYDVRGCLVRELLRGIAAEGSHVVDWNGRDKRGYLVASGLYFAKLKAGPKEMVQRVVLVR